MRSLIKHIKYYKKIEIQSTIDVPEKYKFICHDFRETDANDVSNDRFENNMQINSITSTVTADDRSNIAQTEMNRLLNPLWICQRKREQLKLVISRCIAKK